MVKQETLNEPTKCTFPGCPKLLSSKYNLKMHIDYCHRGVRPHECSICFKRFSSKQNRLEHTKMEHSYSLSQQENLRLTSSSPEGEIRIPNLSKLIMRSLDPDLRPFAKVEKIYLFPEEIDEMDLPEIRAEKDQNIQIPFLMINVKHS